MPRSRTIQGLTMVRKAGGSRESEKTRERKRQHTRERDSPLNAVTMAIGTDSPWGLNTHTHKRTHSSLCCCSSSVHPREGPTDRSVYMYSRSRCARRTHARTHVCMRDFLFFWRTRKIGVPEAERNRRWRVAPWPFRYKYIQYP